MYGFLRQSRVSMLFKEKWEIFKDNWIMFSTNLEITTLFLSPPFKDSALWYNMCLSWSMYVNTVSVNWSVECHCLYQQHGDTTTDKQARKPSVLLASLTYCSYGICLECLKIMLLLALLLDLVIHLSLFGSFKKKWLHTTNLMTMQLATNNNVLFTQKKKKCVAKVSEVAFEFT